MWAHWLMTVFGSVLRHSSLQAAAVALFMGTVPKRVRVSVYLMFWRVLACRMWASMVRVESVLCVVIIYSRYTRLVACDMCERSGCAGPRAPCRALALALRFGTTDMGDFARD